MMMFGMAGKTIDTVQYQSAEKGKKAAEAIKKIDALVEEMQKTEETMKKEETAAENK